MPSMFEPFRDFVTLREAMSNLLEDSFVRPSRVLSIGDGATRAVAVDIFQTENELVVKAAVPGVKPEQLNISVLNGMLTLKGESEPGYAEPQHGYLRREIPYGKFERTFELPFSVQAEQASASFDHGILTVKLPKAEEAKPKQIKISVNSAIEGQTVPR